MTTNPTDLRQHDTNLTILDDWEPIFVNGTIPTEFRKWMQAQLDSAMKFEANALAQAIQAQKDLYITPDAEMAAYNRGLDAALALITQQEVK